MATRPVTEDGRARVLADGNQMPMLCLGVWQVPNGPECVNAVRWALELGYRHIDTAQSLKRLGVDHVDLYIVHWPQGGPTWAWPGMERSRELGHTRSIGVSNLNVGELHALFNVAAVPPAVNQVQFSPFKYRRALLEACQERNVALEAYSPLGTGRNLSNRTVKRVAQRVGRTPAQVLLRWCLQHELPAIAKSTHRERIEENVRIFDFSLSNEDMADLDACDETGGTDRAQERPWW